VPKETNFFIKICQKKDMSRKVQALNKAKNTGITTYIVRRARRLMGVEGNTDICRLLQTFGTASRRDPLSRSFGDFTTGATSWKEGSSAPVALAEGAVVAPFFGSSLPLQKKEKAKTLHKSKERERLKDKILSQQRLTNPGGRKVPHLHGEQKAPRQQL
jgi:hypothetical protein